MSYLLTSPVRLGQGGAQRGLLVGTVAPKDVLGVDQVPLLLHDIGRKWSDSTYINSGRTFVILKAPRQGRIKGLRSKHTRWIKAFCSLALDGPASFFAMKLSSMSLLFCREEHTGVDVVGLPGEGTATACVGLLKRSCIACWTSPLCPTHG